jgi:uncharacterized protein YecE (DUF72 family)
VRLHGRNADTWYRDSGGGTRYDYDYSATDLDALAATVRDLARQAREVHVMFNNNAWGAGTLNALALAELLGVSHADMPELPPAQARLFGNGAAR